MANSIFDSMISAAALHISLIASRWLPGHSRLHTAARSRTSEAVLMQPMGRDHVGQEAAMSDRELIDTGTDKRYVRRRGDRERSASR